MPHLGDAAQDELQVVDALAALLEDHRPRVVCTCEDNGYRTRGLYRCRAQLPPPSNTMDPESPAHGKSGVTFASREMQPESGHRA